MSFIMVPSAGSPAGAISLPNYCSFVVQDDGSGGNVYLNGLGVGTAQVTSAVDLKTFITGLGLTWRSDALLRAFRAVASLSTIDSMNQFLTYLDISYFFLNGVGTTQDLGFTPLLGLSGGGASTPYMNIAGPGAAGLWRVDLKLRHSITN